MNMSPATLKVTGTPQLGAACKRQIIELIQRQRLNVACQYNIRWSFQADDELRLRHWPDLVVRPGGAAWPFGSNAPTSVSNEVTSDVLRLDVSAVLPEVPFGAPVRVNLNLVNKTEDRREGSSGCRC
jgi:hypothetical protein